LMIINIYSISLLSNEFLLEAFICFVETHLHALILESLTRILSISSTTH
jgi:hypothetical protein